MIYWLFLVASVVVASFSQILLKKSAAKKYDNVIKEYLNRICHDGRNYRIDDSGISWN